MADETYRRNPEDPDDYEGVALIRGNDPTMDEFARPGRSVFAEGDGLGLVRRLVSAARRRLAPDGLLALQVRGRIHAARRSELHALERLLATPEPIAA